MSYVYQSLFINNYYHIDIFTLFFIHMRFINIFLFFLINSITNHNHSFNYIFHFIILKIQFIIIVEYLILKYQNFTLLFFIHFSLYKINTF